MNKYKLKNTRYNWFITAENEQEATQTFLEQAQKDSDKERKLSFKSDKIFLDSFIRSLYIGGRIYPNEPGYDEKYDDFYDNKNNEMKIEWELVV
jgi:hypothetical protein